MTQLPSRDELAEDRTILSNERTFNSWLRSALGCIAIGVGFKGLFPSMEPAWIPRAIASGFLVLAVLIVMMAQHRATAVIRQTKAHVIHGAKPMNLRLVAMLVSIGALALLIAIWTVRIS